MKTRILFIAAALAGCLLGIAHAQIGGAGAGAGAGLIVGVTQTATGPGFSVTPEDVRDVVKAMEILIKYAPEEMETNLYAIGSTSGTLYFTTTSSSSSGGQYTNRTRAQAMRDIADHDHAVKLHEADQMDKEQADIKWARGILQKWKDRKTLLDH